PPPPPRRPSGPRLAGAARLHRGAFLAGFGLRDSTSFDDWQYFQAERLRRELAGALERLAQALIGQHRWDDAVDAARRFLALDPLHEPAQRQLMRIYAWSGRRGAALRAVPPPPPPAPRLARPPRAPPPPFPGLPAGPGRRARGRAPGGDGRRPRGHPGQPPPARTPRGGRPRAGPGRR